MLYRPEVYEDFQAKRRKRNTGINFCMIAWRKINSSFFFWIGDVELIFLTDLSLQNQEKPLFSFN